MSEAIYKEFTKAEMEFHFNPQTAVPDHARNTKTDGSVALTPILPHVQIS